MFIAASGVNETSPGFRRAGVQEGSWPSVRQLIASGTSPPKPHSTGHKCWPSMSVCCSCAASRAWPRSPAARARRPGFLHLYIGEEATAVGVCAHLRAHDWITTTHRGHGHALAKGMDPRVLMAELFGKRDGCCGGRGGTMHLYDRSVGLFGTNGIVGAGIGHAVGRRHQRQLRKTGRRRRRLLRRRRGQPRRLPRVAQLRRHPEARRRLRLREQPLRHGDAARHGDAQHRHRPQGGVLRHSRRRRRRQRRARRLAGGQGGDRAGAAPATGRR